MKWPNLLQTRNGRLSAFFLLYITEGIPLGFAATAVATQLRRMGVGPAEIGAFVASFYLPWAFKWMAGPLVDVFRSQRWGHRRAWILGTQVVMVATLLMLIPIPLPSGLALFTGILLVHNSFGAIQDVAIDSLAVNSLAENERGLANGLMFAGASVGQAVGGSGVLFLMPYTGFQASFVVVAASILAVTVLVVLPMKEAVAQRLADANPSGDDNRSVGGTRGSWRQAGAEMRAFAANSFRSFLGTRGAFYGVFFSLLPAGAMSLGLALQSNLAVELGLSDDQVAVMGIWTMVVSAVAMVVGGIWSDRFDRRLTVGLYMVGQSIPVLYLMWELQRHGYVMPRAPGGAVEPALVTALWVSTLAYAVFNGFMYGARSAIMMDVTNPAVAATQFTAYMAMMNLAIAIAATWQGIAAEAWGYPTTLLIDAITGPLCVLLLPAMRQTKVYSDMLVEARARKTARVLALLCLLWLPAWALQDQFGKGWPMVGTFFTLIFISSALFLLAGREVLGAAAGRVAPWALWTAPLLIAMHGRYHLDALKAWPVAHSAATALAWAVPVLGAAVLWRIASQNWAGLRTEPLGAGG